MVTGGTLSYRERGQKRVEPISTVSKERESYTWKVRQTVAT